MTPSNIDEQLTKYLTDAHSIEQQALAQMRLAPKIAGDRELAAVFSDHLAETEDHERLMAERLRARDARPSKVKDAAGALTGLGFAAFAAAQPDTPGKLVVHAFSYEHMEEAAYDLLAQVADRAGDSATVEVARRIGDQERAMGDRLAGCFDRAAQAALARRSPSDLDTSLDKYLADAHAIEAQALQLLGRAPALAGSGELAAAYESHRLETEQHQRLVATRLGERGAKPSAFKDAALRIGALNWGAFFGAQPDTPAKLAAFTYAFEHLEIGAYEMLSRVAARADDQPTVGVAEEILAQENAAAETVRALFDKALDATLEGLPAVAAS
jgi:ferritin-like metal-binding protein YciE